MTKARDLHIESPENLNYGDTSRSPSLSWFPNYLQPSAWIDHIPFAFWLIETLKPATLVELGVYNGTSYFSFCEAIERLNLNTKTYGVDTWKGDAHAGFYENEVFERVNAHNDRNYSKFSTLVRSTFDEARQYFSENFIDILHIDGLHTYDAVKHDFETWLPALSKNAIVIFHDINVREREFGVFKYWEEISGKYPHFEFDFGFGLGVLAIGKSYPVVLQSLFNENKSSVYYSTLKNICAERGSFFKKIIEVDLLKGKADQLTQNLANQERENQQLSQTINSIQEQLESTKKEFNDLTNQIHFANETAGRKDEEVAQLEFQIKRFQEEISQALISIHDVQLENSSNKEEISRLSGSNDELLEKIELSERLNSELRQQLRDSAEKSEQLQTSFQSLKKQYSQNLLLNKELEKEIFVLKHQLDEEQKKTHGEKSRLTDQLNILEKHNLGLLNDSESIRETIQELNRELLLSSKPKKRMKKNSEAGTAGISGSLMGKVSRVLNRFPLFSFYLKRFLLFIKWTFEGTRKKYKYRIDFWKAHRYVPYRMIDDYIEIERSGLFDKDWYWSTYEDVKKDGADPILHYLQFGYYEGRDTSVSFSTLKYVTFYPDVRKSGVNPLLHYLYHGKKEGRKIFGVFRDVQEFPFPLSTTSDATIISTPKPADENSTNQTSTVLTPAEPDFLQRRFHQKSKRDIKAVKTIAFIAQPEYFDFHYREILEDSYTVRYFSNSFSDNPAFFKSLIEFDADINIFFRGELVPEEVLTSLTGLRVNLSSEPFPKIVHNNTIIYTEDSLNRFEFFLRVFDRSYDYIFHYDEISKVFFENQGIELSGYFPFPIATEIIRPLESAKKWDIFFSGRSTPHRDKFFGPLKRDFNFLHINHGVVGPDLLDFIHQCKISINIHAENEISWEPRTQFLMAAGSLLVSEPLSPTCPLRPGVDFIEINDPWKAYETCREVIANYGAYKHIAESGRNRIVDVLSSRKNFPAFFNDLVEGKYEAASFNRNRLKLEALKVNLKYNGFQHLLTELLHEHA